ncbi:sugar phosphate isomerase/epimerase family protein [Ensifer sp.]|jgi:sugar phosphate isomerase/epimerase|uniref:sugar phosphate isomerase/epimerase family protein n=1 Tax=Ensifer sp. TaxID=1872086 RepID=UPI002E10DCAE|nr:TIM barrel protein [Ensifer sp.]
MLRIGKAIFGAGVVHGAAYVGHDHDPVATTERFLLDPRIQAVEGGWDLPADAADDLRRRFLWSGCDVVYAVGGFMRRQQIDPSASTVEARGDALEKLKRLTKTASGYGAAMLLLCTGPDTLAERRGEAIRHFGETVETLCEHARCLRPERPMWITVEHFDREFDQKRLLGPTAETAALVADIRRRHDNVGMTLDLSHLVQLGEDIDEAVAAAGDLLIHAHVANCGLDRSVAETFGDSHCRFGAEGGAVTLDDVVRFLRALVRHGYGERKVATSVPIISVEMKTPEGETPELALASGLRILERAAAFADIAERSIA